MSHCDSHTDKLVIMQIPTMLSLKPLKAEKTFQKTYELEKKVGWVLKLRASINNRKTAVRSKKNPKSKIIFLKIVFFCLCIFYILL